LNRLLAWGHAKIIEVMLEKRPDCPRALSDQFANPRELERALQERGRAIDLEQRTKAESDIAVAAASILARERFIDVVWDTGRELGVKLPRGASREVQELTAQLRRERGEDFLAEIGKSSLSICKGDIRNRVTWEWQPSRSATLSRNLRPGQGLPSNKFSEVVQGMLDEITHHLAEGDQVVMRNFGTFQLRRTKPRIGRNPAQPKHDVPIPERTIVRFKPGKDLQNRVVDTKPRPE